MSRHDLEFGGRECSGFQENVVGNPDLSDVVQEGAGHQMRDFTGRYAKGFGQTDRVEGDPIVVRIGARVLLGHCVPQRADERQVGIQQGTGQIR
jgi:hypothetical protein